MLFIKAAYNKISHFIYKNIDKGTSLYIGLAQMLPPPLTKEEETELLSHIEDDYENVRNTLIERNLRLVIFIAKRFDNTGVNIDDLISIGAIGLVKAVNTFSPDKNIKLATYAARCIENEILMYLRRSCKYKLEVSLDEPLNVDCDGNELLLCDVLGTDDDMVIKEAENEEDMVLLAKALDRLSPREKDIIEMRYGLGGRKELTQKEIADQMGISQSYISRLEKKILTTLKKCMM